MRKYTKEDLINLINNGSKKGLLRINGTIDEIFSKLELELESKPNIKNFMFDINHQSFENLNIKKFDFINLFNCSTISELTAKIINISTSCSQYGNYTNDEEGMNLFKGDLFEIFAEIFFKLTSSDNRVGITDYSPIEYGEDYGVDAIGKDINGLNTTIQVKFRSDVTQELTIKDLHNFQGISYKHYKVPVENGKIIIFTNCKGLHWNTESNVFKNSTITYGVYTEGNNKNLSNLIDGNNSFWTMVINMIKYNIDKYK